MLLPSINYKHMVSITEKSTETTTLKLLKLVFSFQLFSGSIFSSSYLFPTIFTN